MMDRRNVAYFLFCLVLLLTKFQHTTPIRQVATFPSVEDFPPDHPSHLPRQTPIVYDFGGGNSPPLVHGVYSSHVSGGPSPGQIALITIGVIVFMALWVLVVWLYCSRTTTTGATAGHGLELQPLRWKCG